MTFRPYAWAFAWLLAAPAMAEIPSVGQDGFSVSHAQDVTAPPYLAWKTLIGEVGHWWESAHTWSGDAANLYINAQAGGCFCERLPSGGWVEHLRIVYLQPGTEIRMRGALGPLMQMGLEGTMIWKVEAIDSGSRITFTYIVHGYSDSGFESLATAVDGVIGSQLAGLVARLESN